MYSRFLWKERGHKNAVFGKRIVFIVALVFVLLFVGSEAVKAEPSITDWSSSGGNPANKDNPQDLMYLIQPGDEITFSVTTNEPCNFTWEVNKVEERSTTSPSTTDSFTFTVPSLNCSQDPSECIWEIHVKAYNENGEAHHEWVISTLNESEAPDIFDYFTDKKVQGRTETDPWGRALPEWSGTFPSSTVTRAFVRVKGGEGHVSAQISSSIAYGTWKFRYAFPAAPETNWVGNEMQFIPILTTSGSYYWAKYVDAHRFSNIKRGSGNEFSINYDTMGRYADGNWHDITIIRTPDGWYYEYMDGILDVYVQDDFLTTSQNIGIKLFDFPSEMLTYLDNIEVYANKYLFPKPEKKAMFTEYIANYYGENHAWHPIKREGIVIFDRNITLSEINDVINNQSLFTYDPATRTAICYTDLVLFDGAGLIMENETLKFHCDTDGELHFAFKYGSVLRMNNSTITTTNSHYFVWNMQSATTHLQGHSLYIYSKFGEYYSCDGVHGHTYRVPKGTLEDWITPLGVYGRFIIKNSVINNTAHIFFDSPYELDISNTQFTLSLIHI